MKLINFFMITLMLIVLASMFGVYIYSSHQENVSKNYLQEALKKCASGDLSDISKNRDALKLIKGKESHLINICKEALLLGGEHEADERNDKINK